MQSSIGSPIDPDPLSALVDLLLSLLSDPRTGILFALLVIASVIDFRTLKIPNWLTAGGAILALTGSAFFPYSFGHGFLWSLAGLALGLSIMLPLYALRTMGAGDVKLMAMVGAFLGPLDTFYAVIFTFIFGGVLAIVFALYRGALRRMLGNVKAATEIMLLNALAGGASGKSIAAGESAGRLPYGISISIGTIACVVTKQLGYL